MGDGKVIPSDPGPQFLPRTTSEAIHTAPHASFLQTPDKRIGAGPRYAEQRRAIELMQQTSFDGRPTSAHHFGQPALPPSVTRRQPIYPRSNGVPIGDEHVRPSFFTTNENMFRPMARAPAVVQPIYPRSSFNINPAHWTTDSTQNRVHQPAKGARHR